MTISASRGAQVTIKQHIVNAYRTLGVVPFSLEPQTADISHGRRLLDTVLACLNSYGVTAKAQQFYNVQLVAGTRTYQLPAEYVDVIGDGMYIPSTEEDPEEADGETIVQPCNMSQWQVLGSKGGHGRPTRYWCNRQPEPTEVNYWLIPDDAGQVRHQAVLLPADANIDTATLELEPFWHEYILQALCAALAPPTVGVARAQYHGQLATQKLYQCLQRANEMVSLQGSVGHEGPYDGSRRLL